MPNDYFQFRQFRVKQARCAMKVTTDGCLFGGWCAAEVGRLQPTRILDIGAGTGLLSLMVAQQTTAVIDAVEIDERAFVQAKENVAASPWKEAIQIFETDVQAFTPPHLYDCIISNPPFYERELKSPNAEKNTAHHGDGLTLTTLLEQAERLLTDGGNLFLLLPAKRKSEALNQFAAAGWHLHQQVDIKQSPTHEPFRFMFQLGRKPIITPHFATIIIREADGSYHPGFTQYLKSYYLYL